MFCVWIHVHYGFVCTQYLGVLFCVPNFFLRSIKIKLKCVYADKLHRHKCSLPTEEQGSSHCNGWNSPARLVPGKGQSRLISNGVNKHHSENSVNVCSSHSLLAVEEDVWVHMSAQSSTSAETTQSSSLISLYLWKWASWSGFLYSGFLLCPFSVLLRNIGLFHSLLSHSAPDPARQETVMWSLLHLVPSWVKRNQTGAEFLCLGGHMVSLKCWCSDS